MVDLSWLVFDTCEYHRDPQAQQYSIEPISFDSFNVLHNLNLLDALIKPISPNLDSDNLETLYC